MNVLIDLGLFILFFGVATDNRASAPSILVGGMLVAFGVLHLP